MHILYIETIWINSIYLFLTYLFLVFSITGEDLFVIMDCLKLGFFTFSITHTSITLLIPCCTSCTKHLIIKNSYSPFISNINYVEWTCFHSLKSLCTRSSIIIKMICYNYIHWNMLKECTNIEFVHLTWGNKLKETRSSRDNIIIMS